MIFQDPMTSLNPVMRIGDQLMESIQLHSNVTRKDARSKAEGLLADVQIPDARRRMNAFPHELSGGMRQRIMIAIALSGDPDIVLADEPTTALDTTVQAQVMTLLKELAEDRGASVVLITHDLGLVANFADTVAVMYAGRIVESGTVRDIFTSPRHPYTKGLLGSIIRFDGELMDRLPSIPGAPPSPRNLPSGCSFHPRCPHADELCVEKVPRPHFVQREIPGASECHYVEELFGTN